jgi:hypothetical protein
MREGTIIAATEPIGAPPEPRKCTISRTLSPGTLRRVPLGTAIGSIAGRLVDFAHEEPREGAMLFFIGDGRLFGGPVTEEGDLGLSAASDVCSRAPLRVPARASVTDVRTRSA